MILVTGRVSLVEQEQLTLPYHIVVSRLFVVAHSLVFCEMLCIVFIWSLYCLSCDLKPLITTLNLQTENLKRHQTLTFQKHRQHWVQVTTKTN